MLLTVCCINTIAFGVSRPLPDTAKIVPPETMALINISDMNSLQKQFQKTTMYKLYKDPLMSAFINSFKSNWQKTLLESSDEMSKILTDVNAVPSGRLAIAFILNEKSKQTGEPVFLVVSQWGNDIKAIKTAADKAAKKSLENGARQQKETVRGREIITITRKEASPSKATMPEMKSGGNATMKPRPHRFVGIAVEEENEDGELAVKDDEENEGGAVAISAASESAPDTISYCFFDDVLIASEDKEVLKFMISRIDGGDGQSLADNDNYQKTLAAVGPVHDIDFYLNVGAIVKNIVSQDSAGQMGSQIAAFGLDNVSSLGAAMSVGRSDGTPFAVKGLLKINGLKKGIMKLIEPQSAHIQTPRFIDASSVSLSVCNISIKNAYDELSKIMSGISPGFAAAMNTPMVPPDEKGQGGVELKKDILDYLGSGIVVASSIKKPFVGGSDPAKTVTAIAVTNRAAIEKSLATLHVALSGGNANSKRELFGHTIYITEMAGFPFMMQGRSPMVEAAQNQQTPKLAFTVTDTHLILGTEENVAQAIRLLSNKDADSLATATWFLRAKSVIPGAVGMAGLSDSRTYGEYLWWNLKETGKAKSAANAFDPTQLAFSGLGQFFDFSLLPDFDKVKKYFGVSTQYLVSRPDGYYFEARHLDLPTN